MRTLIITPDMIALKEQKLINLAASIDMQRRHISNIERLMFRSNKINVSLRRLRICLIEDEDKARRYARELNDMRNSL